MTITKSAEIAIRAAKLYRQCGRQAALLYAMKRLSPQEMRLYFLARTLEAANGVQHD